MPVLPIGFDFLFQPCRGRAIVTLSRQIPGIPRDRFAIFYDYLKVQGPVSAAVLQRWKVDLHLGRCHLLYQQIFGNSPMWLVASDLMEGVSISISRDDVGLTSPSASAARVPEESLIAKPVPIVGLPWPIIFCCVMPSETSPAATDFGPNRRQGIKCRADRCYKYQLSGGYIGRSWRCQTFLARHPLW